MRLVSTKLTPSEREVLALLATYERGSWRDLLAFFPGSRASLARALAELEKKGLAKKLELPRRRILYEITEQGKRVLEETERGKVEVIRSIREVFRTYVLYDLVEGVGKLAKEGKAAEAEQTLIHALGELLLSAFAIAYRWSKGEEAAFERRLRDVQRSFQPVIWTAWWTLYDLAKERPEVFEEIIDKIIRKAEERL
jgi:DNA-binding PadR family transcriptional regulator